MSTALNGVPEFSGTFCRELDPKNRITIPSRWRQEGAEDEFFLMPDRTNKFLRAMPPAQFRAVAQKVESDPNISAADRAVFMRHFYSRSQHVTADKQGRMLLPEDYCKRLNLKSEVVVLGVHDRFEIWNKEQWDAAQEAEAATVDRVSEIVGL